MVWQLRGRGCKWHRQNSRAWWSLWSGTWRTQEPATTADIACNPPSPDAIPRELGAVFPAGDLAKLNVTLPETCSVGESAQVSVKVPQSVGTNVQVQLKSLVDSSCVVIASVVP